MPHRRQPATLLHTTTQYLIHYIRLIHYTCKQHTHHQQQQHKQQQQQEQQQQQHSQQQQQQQQHQHQQPDIAAQCRICSTVGLQDTLITEIPPQIRHTILQQWRHLHCTTPCYLNLFLGAVCNALDLCYTHHTGSLDCLGVEKNNVPFAKHNLENLAGLLKLRDVHLKSLLGNSEGLLYSSDGLYCFLTQQVSLTSLTLEDLNSQQVQQTLSLAGRHLALLTELCVVQLRDTIVRPAACEHVLHYLRPEAANQRAGCTALRRVVAKCDACIQCATDLLLHLDDLQDLDCKYTFDALCRIGSEDEQFSRTSNVAKLTTLRIVRYKTLRKHVAYGCKLVSRSLQVVRLHRGMFQPGRLHLNTWIPILCETFQGLKKLTVVDVGVPRDGIQSVLAVHGSTLTYLHLIGLLPPSGLAAVVQECTHLEVLNLFDANSRQSDTANAAYGENKTAPLHPMSCLRVLKLQGFHDQHQVDPVWIKSLLASRSLCSARLVCCDIVTSNVVRDVINYLDSNSTHMQTGDQQLTLCSLERWHVMDCRFLDVVSCVEILQCERIPLVSLLYTSEKDGVSESDEEVLRSAIQDGNLDVCLVVDKSYCFHCEISSISVYE